LPLAIAEFNSANATKTQGRGASTSVLAFGGGVDFKVEHRHRGMKLGIAPNSPDDWGRQLAAGGGEENLNSSVRVYAVRFLTLS